MVVEAEFKKGHDTLVYVCDFRREWRGDVVLNLSERSKSMRVLGVDGDRDRKEVQLKQGKAAAREEEVGKYTIVSTSFYDRQICNWAWRDGMRREAVS